MAKRPRDRHPKPDLEAAIKRAERKGWSRFRGNNYIGLRCPAWCGEHQRYVHLSPSDPHYLLNLTKWLERQTCWTTGRTTDDDTQPAG